MFDWNTAYIQLRTLVIFRNLLQDPVLDNLSKLLDSKHSSTAERVEQYCVLVSQLFEEEENLTEYILQRVLTDENIYIRRVAKNQPISDKLKQSVKQELYVLQSLSRLTSSELCAHFSYNGYLPEWETRPVDFYKEYTKRISEIERFGYGIYSRYNMFRIEEEKIVPIQRPDSIQLSDLKGYDRERQLVVDNTLALLERKPAANVLLYGDAGTGKSSTVKAIANAYSSKGLRLIEVPKQQIFAIPRLVETLGEQPLCFILFIDDLSFSGEQEDFGALKAILEGSVAAKPLNVAIYATSNRRHLIKESFSDRSGDDVHRNETIQEQISLSARFGLAVSFLRPDKGQYLHIIEKLVEQYKLEFKLDDLCIEAERFALIKGGRSPRVARQFVDALRRKL